MALIHTDEQGNPTVIKRVKVGPKATGDAQPSDVRQGKTFSNENLVDLTGAIEDYTGATEIAPTFETQTIPTKDKYMTSDLKVTPKTGGNAQASDILKGKTATNDTGEVTGTIEDYVGSNVVVPSAAGTVLSTTDKHMTSDIYLRGEPNFKSENIANGVSMWGTKGTMPSGVEIKKATIKLPNQSAHLDIPNNRLILYISINSSLSYNKDNKFDISVNNNVFLSHGAPYKYHIEYYTSPLINEKCYLRLQNFTKIYKPFNYNGSITDTNLEITYYYIEV